jgi:hypothetical protein
VQPLVKIQDARLSFCVGVSVTLCGAEQNISG